jgi:hypothetical protein
MQRSLFIKPMTMAAEKEEKGALGYNDSDSL